MADVPHQPTAYATSDDRFLHAAWEVVHRSRKLLARTKPLVAQIEGGSVIGTRGLNLVERDPSEDVKQQPDG